MKRYLFIAVLGAALFSCICANGQTSSLKWTEASDLTLVGKVFPDTPDPYKRLDFEKYTGFNDTQVTLLSSPSGIAVSFATDASAIYVNSEIESREDVQGLNYRGYDLYIKKDGRWLWAGQGTIGKSGKPVKLVEHMDGSRHECLMYLPNMIILKSVKIGVQEGCSMESGTAPFKHNIVLYGSSFMHGVASSRPGATVPAFLSRMTGLQFDSFAMSGNAMMQPQARRALAAAETEAFVFDAFSNPSADQIRERLFPFIEAIQETHPGVPLIFMSSIYRETRNFNTDRDAYEADKRAAADSMMRIALKKYKDVYYINSDATTLDHETTVDGVHPGDHGYYMWAESVRKKIVKILRRYGITGY